MCSSPFMYYTCVSNMGGELRGKPKAHQPLFCLFSANEGLTPLIHPSEFSSKGSIGSFPKPLLIPCRKPARYPSEFAGGYLPIWPFLFRVQGCDYGKPGGRSPESHRPSGRGGPQTNATIPSGRFGGFSKPQVRWI